jgi:hypothetical protein
MDRTWLAFLALLAALAAISGLGCNRAVDADSRAQPANAEHPVLLDQEPQDAVSLAQARATVIKHGPSHVTVAAMIGGYEKPWSDNQASFLVTESLFDLMEDDLALAGHHNHDHDHENCPFCDQKESAVEKLAIVQVVGDDGQVVAKDARRLLGVAENDILVVRGRAHLDTLGNLVITAEGIYRR